MSMITVRFQDVAIGTTFEDQEILYTKTAFTKAKNHLGEWGFDLNRSVTIRATAKMISGIPKTIKSQTKNKRSID